MANKQFTYDYAKIVRVIDGDTIVVSLDLGFQTYKEVALRIYGINTPEKTGSDKPAGKHLTEIIKTFFEQNARHFDFKVTIVAKPKFAGRAIGTLKIINGCDEEFNYGDLLVARRWAVRYFSGPREPFPDSFQDRILKREIHAAVWDMYKEVWEGS